MAVINGVVYLAYPIDLARGAGAGVIERVRGALAGRFRVMYDPGAAFTVNTSGDEWVSNQIRDINMRALEEADCLFVVLSGGSPTWGVPAEVERAIAQGVPVVILTDRSPTWSMMYSEDNVTMIMYHEDATGHDLDVSIEHAIDMLVHDITQLGEDLQVLPFLDITGAGRKPTRAYPDDAGMDLYVSETTVVGPGEFKDIPCGVAVELREGTWGLLVGRSSTLRRRGLLVNLGVIDVGYRGELFAGVQNTSPTQSVEVTAGDRVAQLIILPNLTEQFNPVMAGELMPHARGAHGFGSSGN